MWNIWTLKHSTEDPIFAGQEQRHMERTHMRTRGGMDGEIGTDTSTTMCEMDREWELLCNTGSLAQRSVISWRGGRGSGEGQG